MKPIFLSIKTIFWGAYFREKLTAVFFVLNIILVIINYFLWRFFIVRNGIILLSPFKLDLFTLTLLFLAINLAAILPLYKKETSLRQALLLGSFYLQMLATVVFIYSALEIGGLPWSTL